jgi:predicted enzyme related to lactoylglutathione lyase
MKINSLYVCVKDMKRAVAFYEEFFGKKIDTFDERFSIFEIEDFSFGLFDPKKDDEEVVFGNNVVPNIDVDDVAKEYERIKSIGAKIVLEMMNVNGYKLFQFGDSEGNIVEVYQKGTLPE